MLTTILFDMDNTLYPESSGLGSEMNHRINLFVARRLSIDYESAQRQRRANLAAFGTTLKWLKAEQGLEDEEEYLEFIHPRNLEDFLTPSPELIRMLSALPYRRAVLTNAPPAHAERVLTYLGIKDCFEEIFDITYNNGKGKPYRETYEKALNALNEGVEATLLVDDVPLCLYPFQKMGGRILLIDELQRHGSEDLPALSSILDLPDYLADLKAKEAVHV